MRDRGETGARGRRARGTLLLALALAATGATAALAARPVPVPAPSAEHIRATLRAHTLRTVDGKSLDLATLRGEVVVVNFWASWCAPCRKELPRLDALHAAIAPQGGRVLAVSIDEEARNVRRFVRAHRLTLPVYHDGPGGLARRLDLPHVPYTIVLDRDGGVALTTGGADERALEAIAATTRRLLASAPAASPTFAGETPR